MESLRAWLPIAISLVSLLLGAAGWWQFLLQRRREKRDRYRDLLEKFLLPLDTILKRNKSAFQRLQTGREHEVHPLEYYPTRLKLMFESLPDTDPRKVFWRVEIDRIQAENQKAAALIEAFSGSVLLNPTFREACTELVHHITTWHSRWNYALNSMPIPAALENERLADVFPQKVETELAKQIQETRWAGHLEDHHDG